jgi:hypothetical protein
MAEEQELGRCSSRNTLGFESPRRRSEQNPTRAIMQEGLTIK